VQTAQLVLDYVKTLTWPVVILIALLLFKGSIARLVGEGKTRIKGPGFEVQAEAATYVLSQGLTASAKTLTKSTRRRRSDSSRSPEDRRAAAGPPDEADDGTDEAARRDALEHVIRQAATWGWQMAQLGADEPPVPQITWDADGEPHVLLAQQLVIARSVG
jgi:hypothetical protein